MVVRGCVCVCVYTYTYTYMCIHTRAVHARTDIHPYIRIYIYMFVHSYNGELTCMFARDDAVATYFLPEFDPSVPKPALSHSPVA